MNKKIKFLLLTLVILSAAALLIIKAVSNPSLKGEVRQIKPSLGSIKSVISATGSVLPKNRLEIKPPVNGRVESVLVKEGDNVNRGQILAWISSTERAALLDAAQGMGEEQLAHWQQTYKPIALLAPIAAEVIVATTQPGQTVSAADAVVVLSDELIARAQVDETDIGKIKINQQAVVSLDAYPHVKIKAFVGHIYYESKTVNNVTMYEIDLILNEAPDFLRSGMNASIDFIEERADNALIIPLEAVEREHGASFVYLKQEKKSALLKVEVQLGISDDRNVEVISGLNQHDTLIVKTTGYSLPGRSPGTNPFMPARRR